MGREVFLSCSNLTSVVIGNSVTIINDRAFYDCDSLESIIIPDSVTRIGNMVFDSCLNLAFIVIGDSVESIGSFLFANYFNSTAVYYKKSKSDWNNIRIDIRNYSLTSATRYYYVENESDVPTDGGNYWYYVDGVPTVWTKE